MNASVVVGQQNFTSNSPNQGSSVTANTLQGPAKSILVGNKLIVADQTNNRVLIFNKIPSSNNAFADVVIGQQNFTSSSQNQNGGTTPSANGFRNPAALYSDGQRLFIVDTNNHRVLIYNQIPISNNAAADVVLGQSNFTSRSTGVGNMNSPATVIVNNGKIFISDSSQHRVLIWNSIPTSNSATADLVIGQTSPSSGISANQGGSVAANTLNLPRGLAVYNGKLFVSDRGNSRVLIYNQIPTTNNVSADVVIGQTDMISSSSNQGGSAGPNTFDNPADIEIDNNRLYISEFNNQRLLIFNSVPTSNNASADMVIGQQNFTSTSANQGGSVNINTVSSPRFLHVENNQIFLSDFSNNRLLIFNNTINTPSLGISSISGSPDVGSSGKLRISGTIKINDGNYNVWKVEASVNGGDYTGVSNLTIPTFYPGSSQSQTASFYHDFEPWNKGGQTEGNGSKTDWIDKQPDMITDYGYTLKLRDYNTNADLGEHVFYFQPFTLNNLSKTLSSTSNISFSVNKYQRTELKENLDHYEIWVRKKSSDISPQSSDNNYGDWQKYIDSIPIDYDLVREYSDNLRRTDYVQDPGQGNGIYENKDLIVTFTNSSSTISVRKKGTQENTLNQLTPGTYQLKVSSIDKAHHTQDTDPVIVTLKGSPNNKNNLAITSEWFPLQINSISGSNLVNISNFGNPSTSLREYNSAISTVTPMIKGVAFTDSTITLTVTSGVTQESRTYTTKVQDSRWILQPQFFPGTNLIDISAEDEQGRYTELSTITLTTNSTTSVDSTQSIHSSSTNVQEIKNKKNNQEALPSPKPNPSPKPQTESHTVTKSCFLFWCW